jgi:hypothetical protein
MNLPIVSLPASHSKELISHKVAIRNSVTSLLTNHNQTVMVLRVKPTNAKSRVPGSRRSTRRAIFERLAAGSAMDQEPFQPSQRSAERMNHANQTNERFCGRSR